MTERGRREGWREGWRKVGRDGAREGGREVGRSGERERDIGREACLSLPGLYSPVASGVAVGGWKQIPGFHSRTASTLERKQVVEKQGWAGGVGRGGTIVINAADAALCSASGQHYHFHISSPNSLQIPAAFQILFKSL